MCAPGGDERCGRQRGRARRPPAAADDPSLDLEVAEAGRRANKGADVGANPAGPMRERYRSMMVRVGRSPADTRRPLIRVTTSVRAWVSVAWSKCGGSVALADPANGMRSRPVRTSGTRARVVVGMDGSSPGGPADRYGLPVTVGRRVRTMLDRPSTVRSRPCRRSLPWCTTAPLARAAGAVGGAPERDAGTAGSCVGRFRALPRPEESD